MSAHLDNTYGAAYIGMVVAAVLYGISCVQAFHYYTTQNDRWYIKLTVTAVMILDTVHQILISHAVYTYTITDWGDPPQLGHIVWSLAIAAMLVGISALIVQGFLMMRIWRLSENIYLTCLPALPAAAGFVVLIISAVKSLPFESFTDLVESENYTIAVTTLGAVTDILIAATLCTLLHTLRTGLHKSEIIINRLMVFTVNTGLITSLCALAALIAVVATPGTLIFVAFFFCLGRLYTNTLLATFNAREIIRNIDDRTDISYQLRNLQKDLSNQSQGLSVQIDTPTQKSYSSNDQKLEENAGLQYGEGSTKKLPC